MSQPSSYNYSFFLRPMSERHAKQICEWKYPPPYDLYNWEHWEAMLAKQYEFADEAVRKEQYCAVVDQENTLCGFAQFFPLVGVTRLGLGMHPDYAGKGNGVPFVRAIVAEALRRTPAHVIDLEVLVWNDRARIVYERCGFQITDQYIRGTPTGEDEFYCMVYMPEKAAKFCKI
ncbi:GNAT family N-acetyltransferase [Paenibacillus senegalensis]|uniref:GNAT family N-acetyltransferase n=1 Tax=Paenibacillus senegalensis TaxID=1465766 RepID=UPI000474E596|nr:GNAT family N-acetyltransferase [Paenibacillus senegalensis]